MRLSHSYLHPSHLHDIICSLVCDTACGVWLWAPLGFFGLILAPLGLSLGCLPRQNQRISTKRENSPSK